MDTKVKCANCGIPIRWQPTIVDGKAYCCLGCARGGPCTCDYGHLPQPTDSVALIRVINVRHSFEIRRTWGLNADS
jgi:hypothetical protein